MGFFDNIKKATENAAPAQQWVQEHSNPVNPPKEEKETFANDSGHHDDGGGGGGGGSTNPINIAGTVGQGGSAFNTGNTSTENNNGGGGSGESQSVSDAMKAAQEEAARKQAEEQAKAAEAARQAEEARKAEEARQAEIARQQAEAQKRAQEEAARKAAEEQARRAEEARLAEIARQEELRRQAELARQEAIRRQQESTTATNQAAHEEVSQSATPAPTSSVDDAIAQTDANIETIQEQLNFARNNNSTEDILRLTEDLLEAQRHRQQLDAQARAIAGVGTTSTANPLTVAPQVANNTYTQPTTVGTQNVASNFANTLLRPNDNTRNNAFVRNAGRAVQEDEDEFWLGGNPLREAIDRVNSGNLRATDQTYGRPVNGYTQPTTSVYDVNPALQFSSGNPNVQPGITRDQFLEATSNLFSPLANFGVTPAEAALEPHSGGKRWDVPQTTTPEPQTTTLYDLENGTVDTNYNPATDFQTPASQTLENDPMAYWLSREYPAYTGGDWSPTKVNPEWTPANPVPNPVTNPVNSQPDASNGTNFPNDTNSLAGNLLVDTIMATNPISNIADKVKNLFETGRGTAERLSQFFRPQERFAGLYGNLVNAYNNDLTDIPSSNPYAGVYGDTSDLDLAQALDEVAKDPDNPTATELEQANALVTERNTTPKPPVNTSTNASSPYNDALASARDAAAKQGLVPGTLAYDNFVDDHVRAYGNPVAEARNEYGNAVVGAHWTPEEEQQFFNRVAAGIPPTVYDLENLKAPGYDELGKPNTTLQLLLDSAGTDYYFESPDLKDENGNPFQMPLKKGEDGKYYKPRFDPETGQTTYEKYNGEVLKRNRYTPNEILGLYTDQWSPEKGTTWRGPVADLVSDPTLSEEDRAGLNAILASLERGGQDLPNDYSRELFPTQVFDGTEAQYERYAKMFIDKVPGLKELMDSGQVTDGDIVRYFLKSYGDSGSGSGSGSGENGKPQTLPASYGQGDKVVKAPYRKGGYSAAELQAMGNSPYKDYRGYDAYEGYYYNYNDGQWYPVDQIKANYYNENYHSYRGWDEGMRDYYNTFGTFKGYTPTWEDTGRKKSSGSGRSYSRSSYTPRSYSYSNNYNNSSNPINNGSRNYNYTRNVNTPSLTANTQRYDYGSANSTPQYATQQRATSVAPGIASQRSNRVYNIMKNWSF